MNGIHKLFTIPRTSPAFLVGAAFGLLLWCGSLRAADVEMQVSTRETSVGVPMTLFITIKDAKSHEAPVLPEIPGVKVRSLGKSASNVGVVIVNGKVTRSESETYRFQLTPEKPGTFTIPRLMVKADGRNIPTQPVSISVTKSDAGELLLADVTCNRKTAFVGEELAITLQIWIKPFEDREFKIRLQPDDMLRCIDFQNSQLGPFLGTLKDMSDRRRPLIGREVLHPDSTGRKRLYYLYEISTTTSAERPGKLTLDDVSIRVNYPIALARGSGLLLMSDLVISATRPMAVTPQVQPLEVQPIPTANRPTTFNGAVGRYDLSATAKPTTVNVGDPITLTLTLYGKNRLDPLLPPMLDKVPALVDGFRIPTDQLAGVVDGERKTFTVSLRAKSDRVKEIPPIPFSFFDPAQERFVTVQSAAIPITVHPSDSLSASAIVAAEGPKPPPETLSENAGGILANYSGSDLLKDESLAVTWTLPTALAAPPLVFLAGLALLRRREYLRSNVGLIRAREAYRRTLRKLSHLERSAGGPLSAGVLDALAGYVADKCGLPSGGMTRAGILEQARTHGISEALTGRLDALLQRCEQMQYSADGGSAGRELLAEARQCLELLRKEGM